MLAMVFNAFSQQTIDKAKAIDSLTKKFRADSAHIYRFQKLRPYFSIDQRNSFIKDRPVNLLGLQAGVILYEKHTMGFGIYKMGLESRNLPLKVKNKSTGPKVVNQYLNISYATFFYQYTILDSRYFEIDIPVEIGFGNATFTSKDTLNSKVLYTKTFPVFPLGAGLQVSFMPLPWIGIQGMAGYRYMSENSGHGTINYSGWYYSIGANFDFRQIIRDYKFYFIKRKKYRKQLKELLAA